jgi:DNA-binding transcriptional ArsR family regulator
MTTATTPPVPTPKKARAAAKTAPPAPAVGIKAAQRTAILLKNLGDATRVRVLRLLAVETKNVGDMCRLLGLGQPGLSHHLGLMRAGGIVEARRCGKENQYSLTPKGRILAEILGRVMAEDAKS